MAFLLAAISPRTTKGDGIQSVLDEIIKSHTEYWNVSLSMAFGFENDGAPPTVFASAGGVDDRYSSSGDPITTLSKIPSGSSDKAFTAAAILRYVDLGKLDLDDPAHTYIDAWLAKQNPPVGPLLKLWNGDKTINKVTIRQLLSMRSGVKDYDDGKLFEWTLAHPNEDYTPQQFVDSVNKTFEFPPGQGGLYSGTGYVMLGMILSSLQNASSWDHLDQMGPLLSRSRSDGGWKLSLDNTIFMMKGKCHRYPGVTHQYIYNKHPYLRREHIFSQLPDSATVSGSCPGQQYPSTSLVGVPYVSFQSASVASCCSTLSKKADPGTYWQYDGNNCTVFSAVYKGNHVPGFTSGVLDGPFDPTNFQDLYDFSCLNGYTMGNIATTPSDIVVFYSALAHGRVISHKLLAEMQTYHALTDGYNPPPGTLYGLGLLKFNLSFPLKGTSSISQDCKKYHQFCTCKLLIDCHTNFEIWGHPGLDWASGVPFLGVAPDLNVTFAMAFNSYHGFNATLTYLENRNTYQYAQTQCLGFAAAVHHVWPDFPEFNCDSY